MAAVVTARVAVERVLKAIAFSHPKSRRLRKKSGLMHVTLFLAQVGAVSRQAFNAIRRFSGKANEVAHGGPVTRWSARGIIDRGAKVVVMIAGGAP